MKQQLMPGAKARARRSASPASPLPSRRASAEMDDGASAQPPPLTIQRKLLVFSTYAFYLLSLVSIASLLPAIQQQHGWTTGQMIEIASMTTFGARAASCTACLPTAELTASPMRRPGGG